MPSFVFRRIDPRPDELRAARDEAITQGLRDLTRRGLLLPEQFDYPDWQPLFDAADERPEGVWVHHWTISWRQPPEVIFGAAWWTDPVGRQHWYIEEALPDEHSRFYRAGRGDEGLDLTTGRHPLEWLVPPASCGYRERGGRRDLVVFCGCGVAGTSREIGWSGDCCGPCFDRKQDGEALADLPPARPAIGTMRAFALAPNGTLITTRTPEDGAPLFAGTTVRAWAPPWSGPVPLWSRTIPEVVLGEPVCGDREAVLGDGQGYLVLLDLASGQPIDAHLSDTFADVQGLAFSRLAGNLVGSCAPWSNHGGLCLWPRGADGRIGALAHRHAGDFTLLAAQPGGVRVALAESGHAVSIAVFEAVRGRLIERLRAPMRGTVEGLALAADTTVLALWRTWPANQTVLLRWGPAPGPTPGATWSLWGGRAGERSADTAHQLGTVAHSLAIAPAGHIAAAVLLPGGLGLWDTRTLEEKARFWPPAAITGPLAFAPDGTSLLVNTAAGLAVYPWRELIGPR